MENRSADHSRKNALNRAFNSIFLYFDNYLPLLFLFRVLYDPPYDLVKLLAKRFMKRLARITLSITFNNIHIIWVMVW